MLIYDLYLFLKDTIVFFAAGNGYDYIKAPSISVQASAKNVVAVGSSESTYLSTDIDYVSYFSSQGPTYDNRYVDV